VFESRQGLGIFLFATASRPTLGPIQLPIRWVRGALSLGVKRPGREADYSPPSSAEVKKKFSRLGAQLKKSTMTKLKKFIISFSLYFFVLFVAFTQVLK
jgi:hypothetical protein